MHDVLEFFGGFNKMAMAHLKTTCYITHLMAFTGESVKKKTARGYLTFPHYMSNPFLATIGDPILGKIEEDTIVEDGKIVELTEEQKELQLIELEMNVFSLASTKSKEVDKAIFQLLGVNSAESASHIFPAEILSSMILPIPEVSVSDVPLISQPEILQQEIPEAVLVEKKQQ
jgi:hypothetical protein